jgi:rubrerythrin
VEILSVAEKLGDAKADRGPSAWADCRQPRRQTSFRLHFLYNRNMSITLAQAIKNAIAAEQAAEQFYLRLAESCADEKGRAMLRDIAGQERGHAAALEGMAARLVAGQLPERADALVRGIESAPAGTDAEGLGLLEALEIAVDAEHSAILYYDALAATAGGEAALFFEAMGKEEACHAEAIAALLRGLGD